MKLILVLLLSTIVVASAASAAGRPKLRNFASAAEAQESAKQLQQMVSFAWHLAAAAATAAARPAAATPPSACPLRLPALSIHAI